MTCQELADFLMSYLEGELPEGQQASLAAHLELCPPCLAYLRTYEETVRLGRSLCDDPAASIPAEVPEELVQAVLAARSRGR